MSRFMYEKYLKRVFDVVLGTLALILFIPVGLVVATAIKLTSKGPIIFKQERTGLNGSTFYMYKFRTMTHSNNLKDTTKPNELTTTGKIIRALSLDEIPQLINVLKGEMSIVGPRPWIIEYHQHMTEKQRQRTNVLPGITGLAQIKGRNSISVFTKINYDLEYVHGISFKRDAKIVIATILAVLTKKGAHIEKLSIHKEIDDLKAQEITKSKTISIKPSISNPQPDKALIETTA